MANTAPTRWFAPGKGTSTPWGRADYSQRLARGVVSYGTPSHGGLSVTVKWARDNLTLPAQYLALHWGGKLWYEEDAQCLLVFIEHPELIETLSPNAKPPSAEDLERWVRRWDPDYHDEAFRDACRVAGDLPDLMYLQPGDRVKLTGNQNAYRVAIHWIPRGKQRDRVARQEGTRTDFRLTDADVRGRLASIEREGSIIWERPSVRSGEEKRQVANG